MFSEAVPPHARADANGYVSMICIYKLCRAYPLAAAGAKLLGIVRESTSNRIEFHGQL